MSCDDQKCLHELMGVLRKAKSFAREDHREMEREQIDTMYG